MWEAIAANKRRSFFLITVLAAVLLMLGYAIGFSVHPDGGLIGLAVAFTIWLILWLTAMMSGRQILLGSVHAREIQHDDYPVLFNVVEEMTIAAGLPKMPKVYIMDSDAPNAFAVGTPENCAVAVTSGLLMHLNRDELQGVVAHEIGHITNNDTRFMTLAGVMVAAIVLIANAYLRGLRFSGRGTRRGGRGGGQGAVVMLVVAILLAILAPLMAQLLYFACSRRREYLADACSARFTRYPRALASALDKISKAAGRMAKVNGAVAPMFTVNPLKGSAAHSIFSTHPPTEDRIRVLLSMAGGASYGDYEAAYAKLHGKGLIGGRTLAESRPVAQREASEEPEKDELTRARDTVDILHRLNGMLFLSCACGLSIKVPPSYKGSEIHCPRCNRTVPIPMAVTAAAATAAALAESEDQPAAAAEAAPAAVRRTPGKWQSFRCACGNTVQLSPSFAAAQARCPACGRTTRIQSA